VIDVSARAEHKTQMKRMFKAQKASISMEGGDWTTLPTLHHITSRVSEIPIYEIVEGKIVEGTGLSDFGNAFNL
jgi:hypothetical protein